ncbi:hypothetical protein BGZ82_008394 [Podila clonocystis]|nr:hypothetical protein BGZ82_008394 [Podila clonocystis]
MYRDLQAAAHGEGGPFRTAAANARYCHSTFMEEVEVWGRAGITTLVNGKSHEKMSEEIRDLEQQVPEWEYQSNCLSMLWSNNSFWSYPISSMFLVLPSDLYCRDESIAATHQFRLYFLCNNWKQQSCLEDMPQHVHLSNHPGYILKRQQEFFQTYGDYVLRVLLMIKRGYSNMCYEIPPLDALKILWGCDPNIIGSHLTRDTIVLLVDKAINYLQKLSPPKWTTTLDLDRDQSATIMTFLEVEDDCSSEGNLYRYIDSAQLVFWMCQAHVHQYFDNESLERLRGFVQSHGGRVNMQQARLEVELGSPTEAELFRTLLKGCRHRFNIYIKLTWNATRLCVKELYVDIAETGTVELELDGFTLDIDSQGYDGSLHTVFNSSAPGIMKRCFITLLNYPHPQKQSILLGKFLFQSVDFSARFPHSWVKLQHDLYAFAGQISEAQDHSGWSRVATSLQSTLAKHGLAGTNMVIIYGDGWSAAFEPNSGAIAKVLSLDRVCPERVLSAGTITSLGVHVDSLQFDKGFFRAVRTNALLQELNVSYLGHNGLYYTGYISRMWHSPACLCRFTLFDRIEGTHDRVVAQLTIRGSDSQSPGNSILDVDGCDIDAPISQQGVSDAPMDFVLLQWDGDHLSSALSDYSASFLDMVTKQHPLVLTMFTLDVSQLSAIGLSSIQGVLGRSNLEQLHVVCTPFDSRSRSIAQVLSSVQWNTLKSLSMSGGEIDEWCQIWPSPVSPQLLCLGVGGSSSAVQDLSHTSILFLQQLIFSSALMELRFRNVQLQDKSDWVLVIDSIDLSLLQTLDLGEHGAIQFLTVQNAVGLFVAGLEATHLEGEGPKLILPSFTLDITAVSQPGLILLQKIFRYCILEKLIVKSDLVNLIMSRLVAKALDSLHWPLLEYLWLSGDDIIQWIQLLAKVEISRLAILQILEEKLARQEISRANKLSVEKLIGMSSLKELNFKDVLLQEQLGWGAPCQEDGPLHGELCSGGRQLGAGHVDPRRRGGIIEE